MCACCRPATTATSAPPASTRACRWSTTWWPSSPPAPSSTCVRASRSTRRRSAPRSRSARPRERRRRWWWTSRRSTTCAPRRRRAELAEWIPGTIFRCIGLGTIAQAWGGLLAGLPAARGQSRPRRYRGAGQSALVVMFRIDLFLEPAEFRAQMDLLARQLKELAPLEGFDRASYAGDIERQREREFRRLGIPVGPEHRRELEGHRPETGNRRALERHRAARGEARRSRNRLNPKRSAATRAPSVPAATPAPPRLSRHPAATRLPPVGR